MPIRRWTGSSQHQRGRRTQLPIDTTGQGTNFALLGKLAEAYNLTPYDVPYFHLARVLEIPIASRDRGIVSACKNWHVERWQPITQPAK